MSESSNSMVSDTGDCGRLLKYLVDAIPKGPHPEPHAKWVSVRMDVVQASIDHIEWLEKGNEEWRGMYMASARQAETARATARVAIGHLQEVLNKKPASYETQKHTEAKARDWLESIGSEPQR